MSFVLHTSTSFFFIFCQILQVIVRHSRVRLITSLTGKIYSPINRIHIIGFCIRKQNDIGKKKRKKKKEKANLSPVG